MSELEQAHPASWYIAQGIKDLQSVPVGLLKSIEAEAEDQDSRMADLDRRLRIMDTKYNEVLGVMHELGDRIQRATDALIASTKH